MNDSRLPAWIRSDATPAAGSSGSTDRREGGGVSASSSPTTTTRKKRSRAESSVSSWSTEYVAQLHHKKKPRQVSSEGCCLVPVPSNTNPTTEPSESDESMSLSSLLTTLRAVLTNRPAVARRRNSPQSRPKPFNRPSPHGECCWDGINHNDPQECTVTILQRVMDRCRTCPWEADPSKARWPDGESALSVICSLPFPSFEQLGAATWVVQAVQAVLLACPRQVHQPIGSNTKRNGHTAFRQFLRNHRLLRLLLRRPSTGNPHDGAVSDGFGLFTEYLKLAALVPTVACAHLTESWKDTRNVGVLPAAVHRPDSCGLFPIDHLIRSVALLSAGRTAAISRHETETETDPSAPSPLILLEMFLATVPPPCGSVPTPSCACPNATPEFQPLIKLVGMASDDLYIGVARSMIQMLVTWDPSLLFRPSDRSGCLPIHVALDRTSNFVTLNDSCDPSIVDVLIQLYSSNNHTDSNAAAVWTHRNRKGELPLHVACRAGVSTRLLRIVVENTVRESDSFLHRARNSCPPGPYARLLRVQINPWIWSTTPGGASPIDLLWSHFVDPSLSVSQLWRGHHREGNRQRNEIGATNTSTLLLGACIEQWRPRILSCASENASEGLIPRPRDSCEAACPRSHVIDRICLLLRATIVDDDLHRPTPSPSSISSLIHIMSAICVPGGATPTLSESLMDLVLDLAVEQSPPDAVRQIDERGLSALHYCFVPPIGSRPEQDRLQGTRARRSPPRSRFKRQVQVWEYWVMRLLHRDPALAHVPDSTGRLPLHYTLLLPKITWPMFRSDEADKELETTFVSAMNRVVEKLWRLYPESIGIRDPFTLQYPFQLAATSPNTTIDMTYALLRRSPPALELCRLNNERPVTAIDPSFSISQQL